MSTKYKFNNDEGFYFVSFATVGWIDVFTRQIYRDLFLQSLSYCRKEKGLNIHAWVIMSNHIHLIISSKPKSRLSDTMRDLKKYTSYTLLKEIKESPMESRKEWMLFLFVKAGKQNSNNTNYQFWQQESHPIELDLHSDIFEQKLNYIHENPVEAGIVDLAIDYTYSSARDYQGNKGSIEMDVLL